MAADNFYEIISDDYTKDILDDSKFSTESKICTVKQFIDFIKNIIESNATSDHAANPTANPTAYIQVIYKTDDTTDETLKDFIKFGYFLKEEEGKEKVYIFIKDTKIGRNIEDLKKLITAPHAATAAAEGEEEGPAATAAAAPKEGEISGLAEKLTEKYKDWKPKNNEKSYDNFIGEMQNDEEIKEIVRDNVCSLWDYKLENGNIVYEPDVQGGGASDYAPSEISMLGGDPLFLVLSEFFMSSKRGNSLADILEKINDNLEKLAKKM